MYITPNDKSCSSTYDRFPTLNVCERQSSTYVYRRRRQRCYTYEHREGECNPSTGVLLLVNIRSGRGMEELIPGSLVAVSCKQCQLNLPWHVLYLGKRWLEVCSHISPESVPLPKHTSVNACRFHVNKGVRTGGDCKHSGSFSSLAAIAYFSYRYFIQLISKLYIFPLEVSELGIVHIPRVQFFHRTRCLTLHVLPLTYTHTVYISFKWHSI